MLGLKLWPRQAEILRAAAANPRVAVRSGHKIGKSTVAVVLALWFVCLFERARVVLTAPTGHQIEDVLWKELRRVYSDAANPKKPGLPIGGRLYVTSDNGLQFDDEREVLGISTSKPENMAGISSPNMLFIVDEASGYDERIFEVIEGNRAGGARLVMFSNPTQTSGSFYDAFHGKREFWHTIHVSSEEAADTTPRIPGLATREYIDERKSEWGTDSNLYAVRVLGNFPKQGDNAVVAVGHIAAALARWPAMANTSPLELGVDVARFGDDSSVIQPLRGFKALEQIVFDGLDNVDLAGEVLKHVRENRGDQLRVRVKVDTVGNGGGVADVLRRYPDEIELVEVNVGESSNVLDERTGRPKYPKLRDQVWFRTAAWLRDGGAIPPSPRLEGELSAPTYTFDEQARQKVESKADTKKRLGRSPDRADALGLAIYQPPPPSQWSESHE